MRPLGREGLGLVEGLHLQTPQPQKQTPSALTLRDPRAFEGCP